MTKQVQRRRGTSTQHTSFTGAEGEISVNTTNKSIHVHDGSTAGGVEAARADLTNVSDANLNAALSGNTLSSLTITSVDINGGTIDGAVIGGSSAAAGTFTTVTASGDVTIADKIVHSGDTNTAIRFPAADTVTIETDGVERFRVSSTGGRIGIGVTNPAVRLQVAAQSSSTQTIIAATEVDYLANFRSSQLAYFPVDTTGTTFGFSNSNLGALSFLNTTNVVIGTNGATPLAFATTSLERMRITSAGNVGIGTSSPTSLLHVLSTGDTVARVTSGDANTAVLDLGKSSDTDGGRIAYDSGNNLLLHTASAERVRINSSGNVGIGTTSPNASAKLTARDASNAVLRTENTVGGYALFGVTDNASSEGFVDSTNSFRFRLAGTEYMRLAAGGNLGIGTSSPSVKLHVASSGNVEQYLASGTNSSTARLYFINNTANSSIGCTSAGNEIAFYTGATERARIDASGNLGLGVTPSAWGGTFKSLDVGAYASLWNTSGGTIGVAYNAYHNGTNFIYKASSIAPANYQQSLGAHQWFTAPSGTAGNAITFTQAMTLDASGNLGIGTTSPSADLSVGSTTTSSGDVHLRTSKTAVELTPSNSDAGGMDLNVGWVAGGQGPLKFSLGSTERARIDASGNLLVGTTTASAKLTINSNAGGSSYLSGAATDFRTGGNTNNPNGRGLVAAFNAGGAGDAANTYGASITIGASSVGVMAIQHKPGAPFAIADFFPGGTYVGDGNPPTERLRVDNSGNLLVGTTSGSDKLLVRGTGARLTSDGLTSSATMTVQAHNAAGYDAQLYLECPGSFGGGMFASRSNTQIRVWCGNQAVGVSLASSGTSWGSYSDERMKDIIEPITDAANKVSSLRAVIGKYKSDVPEKRRSFLIAQDVQAVLPEAVYQNSEEDDTLSLAYTDMIPLLVAAIKELKAEVDSLRAQLNP